MSRNYWLKQSHEPAYYAWSGYAFEAVCLKHIDQIEIALNISTSSTIGTWRFIPEKKSQENGAQVDLVIDRTDDAINLCEIKYTTEPFAIDKHYAAKLKELAELFLGVKPVTKKHIFLSMISANGLKETMYSEELIQGLVTLPDLFKDIS